MGGDGGGISGERRRASWAGMGGDVVAVMKTRGPDPLCEGSGPREGYELSLRERVAYSALMRTIRFQTFSP